MNGLTPITCFGAVEMTDRQAAHITIYTCYTCHTDSEHRAARSALGLFPIYRMKPISSAFHSPFKYCITVIYSTFKYSDK